MGLFQQLRDKYLVQPVAKQLLDSFNAGQVEKAAIKPDLFSVPTGFNTTMSTTNKRMINGSGGVDFITLRTISVNHETTRAAINARKRQITQLGYDVVDIDDDTEPESTKAERQKIRNMITGLGGPGVRFRELLDKLIEDTLVLDALVFYKQRTRGGQLLRIIPIDGSTIKKVVGPAGDTPLPPDPAFEQWIKGKKVTDLTTRELTYEIMNPRTDSPYGLSPIESMIMTLDASMRAMLYNLAYLSDNNVPQGFLGMPENWTVNQMKEYKEWLDAMISGPKDQAKIFPIPAGTTYQPTSKPSDFAFKDFFDYLDRKVCMMFDLQPQELGLSLQQYKENAEGQEKIGVRKGIKPLANFLGEVFTDIIRDEFGFTNFAFKFTGLDGRFTSEDIKTLIPLGVIGIDEARNDKGLKKLGVKNFVIAGNMVIPVDQIETKAQQSMDIAQQTADKATADPQPVDNSKGTKTKGSEKIQKKKLEKAGRNLPLERAEKTPEFTDFEKSILKALQKQLKPFTKQATIKRVLRTTKADDFNVDYIAEELPSVEIVGLDKFLAFFTQQGGQSGQEKLNIEGSFKLTNAKTHEILGDRGEYLINSVDDTTKDWLVNQIAQGKSEGLTNAQIAQQISDAVDEITSSRANTIVNTEVANAMSQGELYVYRTHGIQRKLWVTSHDDRVDGICAELDDMIVDMDESFNGYDAPPAHPNCRCYIEPVVEDN